MGWEQGQGRGLVGLGAWAGYETTYNLRPGSHGLINLPTYPIFRAAFHNA